MQSNLGDNPVQSPLSKFKTADVAVNPSTASLSSSTSDAHATRGGLRGSMDAAFGKVKDRARKSIDNRRGSGDARSSGDSGRRLSTLMPRRRKRSKQDKNALEFREDVDIDSANLAPLGNRSDTSLQYGGESGRSSLLTDDDLDGLPKRPTISPHQSHAGLLTLSSPEINSQTNSTIASADFVANVDSPDRLEHSQSIPQIVEPIQTDGLTGPAPSDRANSPASRLKEAFKLKKKKSIPDTASAKSASSGSVDKLGLFKSRSRGSTKSDQESAGQDSAETAVIQATNQTTPDTERNRERPEATNPVGVPRIDSNVRPETPPNLVETPTTFVTPPTPTDPNINASTIANRSSVTGSPVSSRPLKLSSVDSIKRRRVNSANQSSKLSQSIPAPLTPTLEEVKTPGGTLSQSTSASGFFSGFFSVAQKAADQLTNTINTSVGNDSKGKATNQRSINAVDGDSVIPSSDSVTTLVQPIDEKEQPAISTLGQGNLNFGHLGLSDDQEASSMASNGEPQDQSGATADANNKVEEEAAARAVSVAYEKPVSSVVSQATGARPVSVASNDRLASSGDQTPPRSGPNNETIRRTGSVRSRISGRRRKHRASSATTGTGNTIAAGLLSTTSGLANYANSGSGHRMTGFAVASSKRNKEFHQLFRSVPEDDYLIEDYSAALQRDILLHGRFYVSEGHICFSSNILGWVTTLVISFDEVVSVEKKSTAVIFPNAIVIQTLHARNTFASFVARDSTYELLIGIWKISHPNLKSSLNGVTLDDSRLGDKTEVADAEGSDDGSDSDSNDDVYDEDADDDIGSFTDAGVAPSVTGSDAGDPALSRKTSAAPVGGNGAQTNGSRPKGLEGSDAVVTGAAVTSDFPGPPTHEATQCTDSAEHYDRPLIDTTIPAPLGKVYSMMFGPASGAFMKKWLVEDQKSRELNMTDDKIGLDNDHKSMTFDYIKPLSAPVGPKQTKCITTNTLTFFDLEKAVSIDCSTQTPDVPSGNVFTTKTKYCLMWDNANKTRLVANCTIEWTGKSWLKGPIEKGANDGQIAYVKALVAALEAAVTTKPPVKGVAKKGKRKGKKEVFDADVANERRKSVAVTEKQATDWGLLEPLHGILSPFISILQPFITSQVIIAVLFVLLAYTWIHPPGRGSMSVGFSNLPASERLAVYEGLWRKEENDLWDWLEDRAGLDGVYAAPSQGLPQSRQQILAAQRMSKKLAAERIDERQMDDAIRTTEERLSALKDAIARKKAKAGVQMGR